MLLVIFYLIISLSEMNYRTLLDFSEQTLDSWRIINDEVMGGISTSNFFIENGIATFSGEVSPENNGGFASVRFAAETEELSGFDGVEIKIRGDGKIYNLRFRTDNNFDGFSYQAKVKSKNQKWSVIRIPLDNFVPVFRGRTILNKPSLVSDKIKQVGLLIADKQFGSFNLDIEYIKMYKED